MVSKLPRLTPQDIRGLVIPETVLNVEVKRIANYQVQESLDMESGSETETTLTNK